MTSDSALWSRDWLEIVDSDALARRGEIRHVLFDFDGTISVIRQGWEQVMVPLMVEMICGGSTPIETIRAEVRDYVDRSTGILTIKQMAWLAEAVRRHGHTQTPLTAQAYKAIYTRRLMVGVDQRIARLNCGDVSRDDLMIPGARTFLEGLRDRGVTMYLASGTDHEYVLQESAALGVDAFFEGGIYGARDNTEAHTKERIIHRILIENDLHGRELLVVGDGPVEIRNAVARGALALGVASDEARRAGWSERKRRRLLDAGAHLMVPDFCQHELLLRFLFGEAMI